MRGFFLLRFKCICFHVIVIGACRPDWREADDELMHASQIIVDTREAAMKESGDVILSKVTPFARNFSKTPSNLK